MCGIRRELSETFVLILCGLSIILFFGVDTVLDSVEQTSDIITVVAVLIGSIFAIIGFVYNKSDLRKRMESNHRGVSTIITLLLAWAFVTWFEDYQSILIQFLLSAIAGVVLLSVWSLSQKWSRSQREIEA